MLRHAPEGLLLMALAVLLRPHSAMIRIAIERALKLYASIDAKGERAPCDPHAEAVARCKLAALRPERFVRATLHAFDPPVWTDAYGLRDDDGGWFVKFCVVHGRVVIISCHGPERPLLCADGTVIEEQQP